MGNLIRAEFYRIRCQRWGVLALAGVLLGGVALFAAACALPPQSGDAALLFQTIEYSAILGMFFAMALGLPVALLPIQILLVNLFTDGLPAVALGLEGPDDDVMRRPPRPKAEGLFAHGLGAAIAVRGLILGVCSCGAYVFALARWGDLTLARTVCFAPVS